MNTSRPLYFSIAALVLFLAFSGYLWLKLGSEQNESDSLQSEIGLLTSELASSTQYIAYLHEQLASTTESLLESREEEEDLSRSLEEEKDRNEEFEDQIKDITGTVGQLDKLAKTDPELLQKYSKVFFLNEHYMPEKLIEVDDEYTYRTDEPEFLNREVMPYFEGMLEDAKDDNTNLWVVSAFRSFDEQADLKGRYLVTYGSGANTFSADQGFSEHQLGTTIDFTTDGLVGSLQGFETTPAYAWLVENAHKYGFVLSYPDNNAYYIYEPWHWRFVGEELADDLHDDGKHFYDLDQRKLDTYLISIFD